MTEIWAPLGRSSWVMVLVGLVEERVSVTVKSREKSSTLPG